MESDPNTLKQAVIAGYSLAEIIRGALSIGTALTAGIFGAHWGAKVTSELQAKREAERIERENRATTAQHLRAGAIYFLVSANDVKRVFNGLLEQQTQVPDPVTLQDGDFSAAIRPLAYLGPPELPNSETIGLLFAFGGRTADWILEFHRKQVALQGFMDSYKEARLRAAAIRASPADSKYELTMRTADQAALDLISVAADVEKYVTALAPKIKVCLDTIAQGARIHKNAYPDIQAVDSGSAFEIADSGTDERTSNS